MNTITNTQKRILIFGSCVSRDIFNLKNNHLITNYYARSSFASINQLPFIDHTVTQRIESSFQAKVVYADMKKTFWQELEKQDFDILLLDFIDERFNLLRIDQTICTLSNEAVSTGFIDEYKEKGMIQGNDRWFSKLYQNSIFMNKNTNNKLIKSGSKEFLKMWETGWKEFIATMRMKNNLDKIILNKVYWAEKTLSGHHFDSAAYSKKEIKRMNKFLNTLYNIAEQSIPSENIMKFSKKDLIGADEHQWGQSPFHYVGEYYESALNFLDNWERNPVK